ncbi:MAG: metallophosphoesterase [Thermoleophilia bacterium]|nr:metallophosphoesterase [Thermoleophilia bacterium]
MAVSAIPFRIAQISDIHVGGPLSLPAEALAAIAERVRGLQPDVVVVAGALTTAGYEWEFEEAAEWLAGIDFPKLVIPGNHDARNVGYTHFQRIFGTPYSRYRSAFDGERAERLQATGFTVVGLDSTEPDVNEGRVGRDRYGWVRDQFSDADDIRVIAIHHHLIPIPGTGRERNIVLDAGDLLATLTELDVDVVLSGHKHVPYFWALNGMLVCNSGTAGTRRIRGVVPPSWNELRIDASTVKVFVHYLDGRRELAAIFSRKTRALTREAFYVTDAFRAASRVLDV